MTCPACQKAAEQLCGRFIAGCRGCLCRSAARSPQFREARDAGRITHRYRLLLDHFGVSHAEVKAAADKDFESRTPA